ncbi:hypothetical protein Csa_000663 [Cucumis sativus]|uniref:Uncharacterized protein n=1 Tax=Cucumis sativus TaxID=3659 RepID=A0A0A0KQW2_CUCSA|nr:hypothetical protein Csa_000663 [Cucumis sativus]
MGPSPFFSFASCGFKQTQKQTETVPCLILTYCSMETCVVDYSVISPLRWPTSLVFKWRNDMKPLEKASSLVAWPMATICLGIDGKSFTHCLKYSLFAFFTFFYLLKYVKGKAISEF